MVYLDKADQKLFHVHDDDEKKTMKYQTNV